MTDSSVATLRAELQSAQIVLAPQIHGLDELSRGELNADALDVVNQLRRQRNKRLDLIVAALAALDALEVDGYPDLEQFPVTPEIQAYFQAELAALQAAFAIFGKAETGEFNPESAELVNPARSTRAKTESTSKGTET